MKRYKQSDIKEIANVLKEDGVVSVPTDTLYGICARINSSKAYDRLVNIKNRPSNKSFPVVCSDIEQIKSIAIVDERSEKLMKAFMPGPITIILNKRPEAFSYINNAGLRETNELAVRMAPSEFLEALIREVGSPLFLTSANKSGENPCKNLEEIEKMCPTLDGIVEGDVVFGQASTIIDCTSKDIKIQRQGPISEEQIMKAAYKEIIFEKEKNRAIALDGTTQVGECDFLEIEEYWNITHTEVDNHYQGQGIARKLVECVMENAKKENKKLIAECSYAKKVLEKYKEF